MIIIKLPIPKKLVDIYISIVYKDYTVLYNMIGMVKVKCLGKDRTGNGCRNYQIGSTRFCKIHNYMCDYTPEMLESLYLCKSCNKMQHMDDDYKTCIQCRERGGENREQAKTKIVYCAKDKCKFKKSDENDYCMKHQVCVFVNETESLGMRVCKNYVRGCKTQLGCDYTFQKCGDCLEKERLRDKNRRGKAVAQNNARPADADSIICSTCCKTYPKESFIGKKNNVVKSCRPCREQNHKHDLKRDKTHRNELARINDAKPERKLVKQKWNEENYDKVVLKTMNYRQNKINTLGVDEYRKQNAENAKKWRENNPEKMAELNQLKKTNKIQSFNTYKRSANIKQLEFGLTIDDYIKLVENPCYYCGIIDADKGFNGIDRKDQTKGYIEDNCASCCKMCNYLKGSLHYETFIKRIIHIITYKNKNIQLYPTCFCDHKRTSYSGYMTRALKKNIDFSITEIEYHTITSKSCYMCGKENTTLHSNGIDRIDNNKGYVIDNIHSCCGECNYMKNNYTMNDIMQKFILIYEKHKNGVFETPTDVCHNHFILKNVNKKTKDELKDEYIQRKLQQGDSLKEKYNDIEYKMKHARDIANRRNCKVITNM